jgi:phosphoglycolate phosphatase-like HAD superfamily hydrolase
MTMHILLDMDGVIADFERGILDQHQVHDASFQAARQRGVYDMDPAFHDRAGVSLAQAVTATDALFWSHLPPLPWAHDLLSICCAQADQLTIVTVAPHADGATGKSIWFDAHVAGHRTATGRRPELAPVYTAAAKHAYGNPDTVLIDDREDTVVSHCAQGFAAILFPAIANHRHAEAHDPLPSVLSELRQARERIHPRRHRTH